MLNRTQIAIPSIVRIKPGALDRVGAYLSRQGFKSIALIANPAQDGERWERLVRGIAAQSVTILRTFEVADSTFERASEIFGDLPKQTQAIVGLGGGKALDTAKYAAFLARLPYYAVPTSLSNDGFCSPQSSLTVNGKRRSLPSALPYAVLVDVDVCRSVPDVLWWSGVGDIVAKVTAIADWKLAFYAHGTPIDDFAALLSDATVYQFLACPERDHQGTKLMATSLMLNGIAMEMCGSSRPASGSEHLISHALDLISARPRLHGLQVGVAAYLVSRLQGQGTERIAAALDGTRFWKAIEADPFLRGEWLEAVKIGPGIKEGMYTVLSSRNCLPEAEKLLRDDPRLARCFVD